MIPIAVLPSDFDFGVQAGTSFHTRTAISLAKPYRVHGEMKISVNACERYQPTDEASVGPQGLLVGGSLTHPRIYAWVRAKW
jgi:hypothetical protein